MVRRSPTAQLSCESLEARDVPAIILNAAFNTARTDVAPLEGAINISEIALTTTNAIINRNGTVGTRVTKPANSVDQITFTLTGSTLTITNPDGIFGRVLNPTTPSASIVTYGTTLTIPNVTRLTASLQLGGDDRVTDNTTLAATIAGGPGNDTITAQGLAPTLDLAQALLQSGPLSSQTISLLTTAVPPKAISGSDGNDVLSITGFAINCTLDGGAGDDVITVPLTSTVNVLAGGAGNDSITGGLGLELLDGGAGNDTLIGSGGRDIFSTRDVDLDLIVSRAGDIVFRDPFDILLQS